MNEASIKSNASSKAIAAFLDSHGVKVVRSDVDSWIFVNNDGSPVSVEKIQEMQRGILEIIGARISADMVPKTGVFRQFVENNPSKKMYFEATQNREQ